MIRLAGKIFFLLLTALMFTQCTDNESTSFCDPDVKIFVQQIKSGRYNTEGPSGCIEVPDFKRSDIPSLLFFAKEHIPIKDFPINPVSSINLEYYRLSQCLLWTVEKIRVGNYPSQTPALMKKDTLTGEHEVVTNPDDINEVWELYNEWWTLVEKQPADSSPNYYSCNPLSGTIYSWY